MAAMTDTKHTPTPHAFDNGVMARKYGIGRDECRRPHTERLEWQKGWDAEDARRAAKAQEGA